MQQTNFNQYADDWWNKEGDMRMLHTMHETRMLFIKERILKRFTKLNSFKSIIEKKKILDLGCGGGLLAESLANYGENIVAIDSSEDLIKMAKKRALEKNIKINYKTSTIEKLAKNKNKFDIIISLEVIEHVNDYKLFLNNIFKCLNKNGIVIISTINRNIFSYITTILFAEKILKIVPDSVHNWNLYLKPSEILNYGENFGLKIDKIVGLFPLPNLGGVQWIRTKNTSSNYILSMTN